MKKIEDLIIYLYWSHRFKNLLNFKFWLDAKTRETEDFLPNMMPLVTIHATTICDLDLGHNVLTVSLFCPLSDSFSTWQLS